MKMIAKAILTITAAVAIAGSAIAQESSSSSVMRRGGRNRNARTTESQVTQRMQNRLQEATPSDADLSWMKVVYRSLDLNKVKNAPLYFPEQPEDGAESLFRMIMRLIAEGRLDAYEYLDGREVFNDANKIKVREMLDRFHIYAQEAKGSSEKHPKFAIEASDVPATEVLSYYIIEKWEFDNRTNRMRTRVEAICPVLHRSDDYGMEAMKYPMFWVKYSDLRPFMSTQNIFISDDNNLPTCTYDDYFRLGLYEGDIYKTRNLRNRSMAQLYPNPDDMKRAQDSIQQKLEKFEDKLWVPSLEELQARSEAKAAAEEAAAAGEEVKGDDGGDKPSRKVTTRRGQKKDEKKSKPAKVKKPKAPKAKSAATRSVRNRKR